MRAAIIPRWGTVALAGPTHAGIQNGLTEIATTAAPSTTPKNHSRRSVPPFLSEILAAHCEGKRGEEFVFTAPAGGALRNRNWQRRSFQPAMAQLLAEYPQLTRMTPHDLRHTAVSWATSAGANVKAVQKMLGHASAAMTLDVYADLFDDLDAVGEALSRAGDPRPIDPSTLTASAARKLR